MPLPHRIARATVPLDPMFAELLGAHNMLPGVGPLALASVVNRLAPDSLRLPNKPCCNLLTVLRVALGPLQLTGLSVVTELIAHPVK